MMKFFICFVYCIFFLHYNNSAQYVVTTYAGSTSGYVDGDTSEAKFKGPFGICIDADDNLYIADADNHCIRKITPAGMVSTYAGTGALGYADGPAATAQFNAPSDVCADAAGNIYVSDFANQRIRKIDAGGNVSTVAGNGNEGYVDGDAGNAEFDYPRGIVINSEGILFIADSWNHRIRKIDIAEGVVSTFAGGGINMGVSSEGDYVDGADTSARFYTPSGLSIDAENNLYLADAYNHRIRLISPDGVVSTIAGSGTSGPGLGGFTNGTALTSLLNTPTELFVAPGGEIYIGDTYNNAVRILSDGMLNTVAGNGNSGYVDGDGTIAEFKFTRGVVMDAVGEHLYVCDYNNRRIRKITMGDNTTVNDHVILHDVSVFPNPNNGIFSIEIDPAIQDADILIEDANGRIIYAGKPDGHALNIVSAANGLYFVKVISGERIHILRLIKE